MSISLSAPRFSLCKVVLLALTLFSIVFADVTGTILGTVRDSTGAVVSGATIVVTNVDTNAAHQTKTDTFGNYQILALPIGRYRVDATMQGFQKYAATGIELTVNEQRRIDISMQIGTLEQVLQVNANAVQVETTNSQLGEVIDQKKVLSLPLNGRSYIDLLGLQAGVAPVTSGSMQQDRPVSGGLSAGNISVNGGRETANAFLVNGGDVSEGRNLGTAVIPNIDSVAEFRLITNSFDAEYGKFSGAVMNAITKSGTNSFHGTVFEFLRNDKLDSRGFFDPTKGALRRNQYGYAVGGPMWKNRLFWFTDYQGTRETRGISSGLVELPSPAERAGDFSEAGGFFDADGPATVKGPYWAEKLSQRLGRTVVAGQTYNSIFPDAVIPQRAFSAPAVALMKFIPQPNQGAHDYATAGQNQTLRDDKAGQRVDFLSQKTGNWFIYYFFDDSTLTNPLPASSVPGFPSVTPTRAQQAVLSNTKVFGPTTVNEVRLAFMRTSTTTDQPQGGFGKLSDFGFQTGPDTLGIVYSGPPGLEAVPPLNFNAFSIGSPTLTTTQPDNTWHFSESLSKVVGRHTMKFGGEFRYFQINERNVCAPNGSFDFDGFETGIDFADYLLGAPTGYTQCSQQFLDSRSRYGGLFAQDSFRLRPNLTLNYGLRYDVSMPWYDTQDKIETIVPGLQSVQFPTAPTGWVVPGDPGIPKTLAPTRWNNFGPRIGVAYSPGFTDGALGKVFGGPGKTSIRVAYGLYYTSIEDLNLFYEVGDAPYGLYWPGTGAPILFDEPFRNRGDGVSQRQRFPFTFPTPGDPANKTLDYSVFLPISGSPGYDIHNRVPYAEHYNITLQRTLSPNTVMTLAYVGTQGHRLIAQAESNPGDPNLCLSLRGSGVMPGTQECGPFGETGIVYTRPDGSTVNTTRGPLGENFGSNAYTRNFANSNYNSFQASVERRASNITFLAAYTWGKAIDNSSAYGEWVNFSNYGLSRALSQYDISHNFVFSYDWVLPFEKMSALPKRLTQGWDLVGITRFATGFPITIRQSGDRSLVGSGSTDAPDRVGEVIITDPRGEDHRYFNSDAFRSGPLGSFGNSNRRFFHGPGINNFDLGLHKSTVIRENMTLMFRAEFFNLFNHAQFRNPTGNFSSGQFGLVTNARDPRIGQMSLKFLW